MEKAAKKTRTTITIKDIIKNFESMRMIHPIIADIKETKYRKTTRKLRCNIRTFAEKTCPSTIILNIFLETCTISVYSSSL